jgi:hypothetical protein
MTARKVSSCIYVLFDGPARLARTSANFWQPFPWDHFRSPVQVYERAADTGPLVALFCDNLHLIIDAVNDGLAVCTRWFEHLLNKLYAIVAAVQFMNTANVCRHSVEEILNRYFWVQHTEVKLEVCESKLTCLSAFKLTITMPAFLRNDPSEFPALGSPAGKAP